MALTSLESTIKSDVQRALEEDLGGTIDANNDITANLIPSDKIASATIITREDCILCGVAWATEAFTRLDPNVEITWHAKDGDRLAPNDKLVTLRGQARALLTAERTALNFLQTLSATATVAAHYAQLLANSNTAILDTRKTLPGLRMAQKYAVKCGGGQNHRIGLFDAYLIKENHIAACGSIANAVSQAKAQAPGKPVEVEVESLAELQQALDAGCDIVMLDNFSYEDVQQAVTLNQGKCKLEVSGNITDEALSTLSTFGVDYISSGALTKHVSAIDLSLRIEM